MTYADWIAANVKGTGKGQCAYYTQQMVAAFPELRRVRGHYRPLAGGSLPHWWCAAPDGTIVDPTVAQFQLHGPAEYDEWTGPVPTGRCPNCGNYAYDHQTTCSAECATEFAYYLENV